MMLIKYYRIDVDMIAPNVAVKLGTVKIRALLIWRIVIMWWRTKDGWRLDVMRI